MRLAGILFAAAAVAAVAAMSASMRGREQLPQAVSASAPAEPRVEPAPRNFRDVTPANVLPAPKIEAETIVRLPSIAKVPPPPKPKPVAWTRTKVVSAGRLVSGDVGIVIAGVEALEAGARCELADGGSWPCGNHARAALQRLIRGRTVECDPAPAENPVVTACRIAGHDIGEWLVEQGWAMPVTETEYAEALAAAREEQRGQWRER